MISRFKFFSNKKGFSLVELMVVVAIIGILGAIGIPAYSKFRQKAYSAEAKASLSNLFVAEHTFFLEYGAYHSSLDAIGFMPPARGRYNVGFGYAGFANASSDNGYYATLTTQQAANISSKKMCSGFGEGTSTACSLVIAVADVPFQIQVVNNQFVAAAVTNELVAFENFNAPIEFKFAANSPALQIFNAMLFSQPANAVMTPDPVVPPSGYFPYSFDSAYTDPTQDVWSIDNTKTMRHALPADMSPMQYPDIIDPNGP